MYKFKPATDRIKLMHQLIRDRVSRTDAERALIVTLSNKRNEHVVPIIKRARAAYDICSQMTIRVEDFEIIVGNKAKYFLGSCVTPEWSGEGWIPAMVENGTWSLRKDGLYHNPDSEELNLSISPEDVDALFFIRDYWKGRTISATADAWQPDGYEELCRLNVCTNLPGSPLMMMTAGHLTPGFNKIIHAGYAAIREQAKYWLDVHRNNLIGEDIHKCLFYEAAVIVCDAASVLVRRNVQACIDKAAVCEDEIRKSELMKMGDSLIWISENPARTFWEACQAAILYQLFLALETGYPGNSFGRFDQYTWPFLEADLEAGRLTLDEAQEVVDAFFLKTNCFYGAAHPSIAIIIGIGNTYQHTNIGGVDPDTGEDASNPVTYMVLETIGRLGLHDPTTSLRINRHTPDELWNCAIETSHLVGGLPMFQNDEVIIPGLMRELEFELRDARDYAVIGCQEITGSGNDYPASNGISPPHASVHCGVVLDMAINNGINPFNGEQMKWVCDTYHEICCECYSTRTKHFKAGLYSASDHVFQGYHTWATPDGRKTGEPMADATSPAQGRDRNGPTAVFNSARCFDHSKFMDGLALNIRIHPSALSRTDGIAKLRDLTRTYLNSGGMEVQYNIVSAETMRAAQKDPASYRDLVVRIAGYSACFIELSADCQNDIISRTENSF